MRTFIPQKKNANKHTPHGLRLLEQSLQRDGFIDAQTAAADGEIISGSARLEVSAEKFADVEPIVVESDGTRPVIVVRTDIPSADDPRAKRLSVAANQIAHTDFDPDGDLLKEWAGEDEDIRKMFADSEWQEIAGEEKPTKDAEPQIDKAAELLEKWQVREGQMWILGNHRLLCGDCTSVPNVERLMEGVKADMVLTDPPYGMDLDADFSDMVGIASGNKYDKVEGDDVDYDPSFLFSLFGYCKEIFLWGADYYAERIPNRNNGSWIVWDKMSGGDGVNDNYEKMFGSNFELCWSKQKHKRALARVLWKGIFGLSDEPGKKRYHPTQKPVKLYDWFLDKFSKENHIVVDLYAGVGSLVISCENHGVNARVMEREPKYCAVIIQRWVDVTGLTPVLSDL